jgi:hypothetical protein
MRRSPVVLLLSLVLVSLLSGCVTSPYVQLKPEFWTQADRSVGVAVAKLPAATTHKVGQQGLLDMAINEAMADELSKYLKTLDLSSYGKVSGEAASRMQAKGLKVREVGSPVDVATLPDFKTEDSSRVYAQKDFRSLKQQLGVDRLLLLTVTAAGTQRSYYGFIPTSSPIGLLSARGEIVDLNTNEILWRQLTTNTAPIDDPWDQPPNYPNVSVAVQKVILMARRSLIDSLFGASVAQQ